MPSVVAFVRDRRHLVARLATIKNALVRCAKGAGAVFTGEMRYRGQRKKGRGGEWRERDQDPGEARQAGGVGGDII